MQLAGKARRKARRDRSFKLGLCPTSDIYVFVNTFNLKEMFSVEIFYCFTVVLQCLTVVLQRFTVVSLCGFTGVLLSVGFRVLIGGITTDFSFFVAVECRVYCSKMWLYNL